VPDGVSYVVAMPSADAPSKIANSKDVASVERVIKAPAHAIFEILADPARHAEIDGSGAVRDATDGSERLHLGSVFGMNMKLGIKYAMENTVVEFVEDQRIAWQPRAHNKVIAIFGGGRIWRYELEPVDGGTLVRETWDIREEQIKLLIRPMRSKTIEAMTKTLERIDAILTA
jgi:uncharacterized protein YndB with AHSA1/START domain